MPSSARKKKTEIAWAAKASLASIRSRSAALQPARSRHRWLAGIGTVPRMAGSTPTLSKDLMVASDVRTSSWALSALHTRTAASFSFWCYAEPRVLHSFPTRRSSDLEPAAGLADVLDDEVGREV